MTRWLLPLLCTLQILTLAVSTNNTSAVSCQTQASVGYSSADGCTFQAIKNGPLRVFYMDEQYVTQNPAAIAKIQELGLTYSFGSTCDDPATAVPEWSLPHIILWAIIR